MERNISEEENISKVFLNPLILENIFSHIPLKDNYSYRLVSPVWKNIIDKLISRKFIFKISFYPTQFSVWRNYVADFKHFVSLKLTNLYMVVPKNLESLHIPRILHTFNKLSEHGTQITKLELESMCFETEEHFVFFEMLAKYMPNLKKLELLYPEFSVPHFLKFHHVFKDCKEVLIFPYDYNRFGDEDEEEAFVKHAAKVFPNLGQNFGNAFLDKHLFQLLREGKCHIPLRNIVFFLENGLQKSNLDTLAAIPLANVPLVTKLEIWNLNNLHGCANALYKVLKNFAPNLKYLHLTNDQESEDEFSTAFDENGTVTIFVPPLPNIRIMELGMPLACNGIPCFLWDLGNCLAKDFPLLQELEFKFENGISATELADLYSPPFSWSVWEPLLPILRQEVDLSPFRYIRRVNLTIPKLWLLRPENEEWKKAFLSVFSKLYDKVEKKDDYDFIRFGGVTT